MKERFSDHLRERANVLVRALAVWSALGAIVMLIWLLERENSPDLLTRSAQAWPRPTPTVSPSPTPTPSPTPSPSPSSSPSPTASDTSTITRTPTKTKTPTAGPSSTPDGGGGTTATPAGTPSPSPTGNGSTPSPTATPSPTPKCPDGTIKWTKHLVDACEGSSGGGGWLIFDYRMEFTITNTGACDAFYAWQVTTMTSSDQVTAFASPMESDPNNPVLVLKGTSVKLNTYITVGIPFPGNAAFDESAWLTISLYSPDVNTLPKLSEDTATAILHNCPIIGPTTTATTSPTATRTATSTPTATCVDQYGSLVQCTTTGTPTPTPTPDPCTGQSRGGSWTITTYYAPVEDTVVGDRTYAMPLDTGSTIYVKPKFFNEIVVEGFGQISSADPLYPNMFVSGFKENGVYLLRSQPIGNRENPLAPCVSIAADKTLIAFGKRAGFSFDDVNGCGKGDKCGRCDDVGKAINGPHIDFYVGVRDAKADINVNPDDPQRYIPVSASGVAVSVQP